MPITIEEFRKLSERRFPPLVEYLQKRFGSKRGFLSFLTKEAGIEIPARSYDYLMEKVFEKARQRQAKEKNSS